MFLLWFLHSNCRKITKSKTAAESKSLRWKKRLLILNVVCILVASYFFVRHNSMCEPYGELTTFVELKSAIWKFCSEECLNIKNRIGGNFELKK